MLLDLMRGLEERDDKGFDFKSLNKLGRGYEAQLVCLGFFWGGGGVMACTLVAFGHSKVTAMKQKLSLGTDLLQTLRLLGLQRRRRKVTLS